MGGGQNTYNPLKNKGRNKKIITIIILLILIVVTFSFALGSPSINLLGRRNIKISKCELDINFKESDELMLVSKYPISTRQALEGGYKPKTVTITNNSTCDMAYYKITIKDLINSSINKDVIQYHVVDKQNTMTYKLGDINNDTSITASDSTLVFRYLRDRAIKTTSSILKYAGDVDGDGKITENDNTIFGNYISKQITTFPAGAPLEEKTTTKEIIDVNPDTFLIESSLEKGKTHEYEIIMWISNAATNNDLYINGDTTKPIEYKYALNIEATDKKPKEDYALEFALANVGQNGLEEVTHEIDDTLQVDSKFASEYRYRGGNVANYVTFNNEVWRIIGVIPTEDTDGNVENRFKIIRDESIGEFQWDDGTNSERTSYFPNDWSFASLNAYLNNDYYNTLTTDAKNMIGTTKYYLGGYGQTDDITSDAMWQYERKKGNGKDCTTDNNFQSGTECYFNENDTIVQNVTDKKIALLYASDFLYAQSGWLEEYKSDEWLLTQVTAINNIMGYVYVHSQNSGLLASNLTDAFGGQINTRPVLTLSFNVKILSGSGTSSDPYQLQLD